MKAFAAEQLKTTLNTFLADAAQAGPDGLAVIGPDQTPPNKNFVVHLPGRLNQWLLDLRLLRHVPLAYLVPDPALLPPESIRCFHVDRTWTDRLIDGAMSAGNIGTLDMTFTAATLTDLRRALDDQLGLAANTPISGMLIRSELVERWPDLIVEPKPAAKAKVIRQETLSRSLMIVLFAGTPTEVHLREPDVGLRFGVEVPANTSKFVVNLHDTKGKDLGTTIEVKVFTRRVLHVTDILSKLGPGVPGDPTRSRDVAINLRQDPYAAVFRDDVAAARGSVVPRKLTKVTVRGREIDERSLLGARAQGDD